VLTKARAYLRTSWLRVGRQVWPLAMGLGLSLLVLTASTRLLERAELAAYDAQARVLWRHLATPNDIVIVGVSQPMNYSSVDLVEKDWVPRASIARAIDILHRAGARAVGIGLDYEKPSSYGRADDAALARAIKRAGNVVLTSSMWWWRGRGTVVSNPVAPLAKDAAGLGVDNLQFDSDGVMRSAALVQSGLTVAEVSPALRNQYFPAQRAYPSWPLVVASVALHQPISQVLHGLPTNMLVNYGGPQPQAWYDLDWSNSSNPWNYLVFRDFAWTWGCVPCSHAPHYVNGRKYSLTDSVVLILPMSNMDPQTGVSTPVGGIAGELLVANILNTILRRNPILPVRDTGNSIILLLVGMVTAIAASRFSVWRSTAAVALVAIVFAAICVGLFAVMGIWVRVVAPEATIALVFLGIVAVRARVAVVRQKDDARYALQLAVDLQQSREQLVALREEERRRLRRDLHDGLGPALSSVLLKVSAARRLLEPRSQIDSILLEARGDIQTTIEDVRRLVYDLRPPTLDELGLTGAIRESVVGFEHDGLLVTVRAPEHLPPLPAAVEVAAYRIIQEALTNVVRHAAAQTCTVELAIHDGLDVDVTDDGVGLPGRWHLGVGLTSMRERARELGGTCVTERAPGGGTRVRAHLPLPEA
jgi:signal transduction histidine kinase